ncbi:alpha/beta hydrolase [Altererythrobacter sp.]|uniref:alpha/beta hydrolase n=1 Tax=Altererythrobacter sp. TaxID=1872480 RepID=UPI003D04A6C0
MVLSILGTAILAYATVVLAIALSQRQFIYPAPKGPGEYPPGFEEVNYRTVDGLDLKGGYKSATDGNPTIVYFHGNGADWQSSVVATHRLRPHGYGVFAVEYRGYRGNPGKPNEVGLYRDGRAALAWLEARGVQPEELVLIGNSIGSGVATQLATEVRPRALVLISPFASLTQVASEKLWWLPVGPLLRDRFDNQSKIASIAAPVLILHGDADALIPDSHSRILAKTKPGAKLVIFPEIGHELAWDDAAERTVLAFLEDLDAQE